MDLYIFRHAWAGQRGDPRWPNDDLRPLSEEGKDRFAAVAKRLVKGGVKPTRIATSPLVRCVETARVLADTIGRCEVVEVDALRPGGDLLAMVRWTERLIAGHPQIAWVGHAPDVDRWTAALIGDACGSIHFSKGAVAAVRFDDAPAVGGGELRWLATAKLLDC